MQTINDDTCGQLIQAQNLGSKCTFTSAEDKWSNNETDKSTT